MPVYPITPAFFFNDTATTEIYTLSLHDALPISVVAVSFDVATHEFAERGHSGASVDGVAPRTRTTKRMIYYYWGGKEELYIAVLERAYAQIREGEQTVDVEHLDP